MHAVCQCSVAALLVPPPSPPPRRGEYLCKASIPRSPAAQAFLFSPSRGREGVGGSSSPGSQETGVPITIRRSENSRVTGSKVPPQVIRVRRGSLVGNITEVSVG